MGESCQNVDSQNKNEDFICSLFNGGFYHILELILTNLPLKAILSSRMVSSGMIFSSFFNCGTLRQKGKLDCGKNIISF
jgi:hypothetical protein